MEWEVKRDNNLVLVPDFRRANYEGLRRHLEEINWDSLVLGGDSQGTCEERTYNNIVKAIGEGQKQHIPYRYLRKDNSDPKWMTREGLSTRLG